MQNYTIEIGDDGEGNEKFEMASVNTLELIATKGGVTGKEKAEVIKMAIEMYEEQEHKDYKKRLLLGEE
jgi:hypothetical protein